MEMTLKAQKIQNELDRLDEEIKGMYQKRKDKRDLMYMELGKEFYKATESKSYAEAFSKIGTVSNTTMNVSQSNDLIDNQDIQFLINIVAQMSQDDHGNWRLSREKLQTLVNRIHDMFNDSSTLEQTPDERMSADVSFLR